MTSENFDRASKGLLSHDRENPIPQASYKADFVLWMSVNLHWI